MRLGMDIPILILAWRRPDTLRQLTNAIRLVAPTRLFVACDGPNLECAGEVEKVAATRQVIEQEIDWPCQVELLYSEVNQGCRLGVSRAVNWFFEHVEEGIILEDDCIPNPDFFVFCSALLERYRLDMRVWCISGNNFQDGIWSGDGDYFFGQIPMCWGWATWRSRWEHYDSDLKKWPLSKKYSLMKTLMPDAVMRSYWTNIWERLWVSNQPDSWAYRWVFTCVFERGLTVLPKVNLVENVGFGVDATHTISMKLTRPALPLHSLSLSHPSYIASLPANDAFIFNHYFGGKWKRFPLNILKILLSFPRKVLREARTFFRYV